MRSTTLRLAALALLCACSRTPEYRLDFEGEARELGAVRISERVVERIEVTNTGRQAVTIDAVALADGHGGVLGLDEAGTGCVAGQQVRVGEHCVVAIAFEPANDIVYRDSLHVDYRPTEGDAGGPLRVTLRLSGTGLLDCSVSDELSSAYDEGVADAQAQIETDIAEATAAGEALTRDDGYADGYDAAYTSAHRRAYDDGYDDGLLDGYDDGYAAGASAEACRDGELDGFDDGYADGLYDGETDGVNDGDLDGYDDGYADGYYDGETDGCGYAAKIDPDPSLPGKCVDQGYDDTYSRSHYDEAFAAAAAANTAYQEGLAAGRTDGDAEGRADGYREGHADGYLDGEDQGFADGDADQYDACYLPAFDAGYVDGYADGYETFYWTAYDAAYDEGYAVGYDDGWYVCS